MRLTAVALLDGEVFVVRRDEAVSLLLRGFALDDLSVELGQQGVSDAVLVQVKRGTLLQRSTHHADLCHVGGVHLPALS